MILDIAVIKGDGVGPEMLEPTLEVLKIISEKFNHQLELYPVVALGEAIEAFGNPMPEESLNICKEKSAVLFGNAGLSKYKDLSLTKRPEYGLARIRKALEVHTCIRPITIYPSLSKLSPLKDHIVEKGVDIVFVRDIVGGVLCSEKVKSVGKYGKEAYEREYYNEMIIKDTATLAFELASKRNKKVTVLDKSNALESSKLWKATVYELGKQYPEVELSHYYIDLAAMKIIENPSQFDVVVASNLFGDIISDAGTQITGAPYLFGSAEISKSGKGVYTPNQLHNPDESIIGKDIVNPIGMISAATMMLRLSFGLEKEARCIEDAIKKTIESGYRTRDMAVDGEEWISTKEMGEKIIGFINQESLLENN